MTPEWRSFLETASLHIVEYFFDKCSYDFFHIFFIFLCEFFLLKILWIFFGKFSIFFVKNQFAIYLVLLELTWMFGHASYWCKPQNNFNTRHALSPLHKMAQTRRHFSSWTFWRPLCLRLRVRCSAHPWALAPLAPPFDPPPCALGSRGLIRVAVWALSLPLGRPSLPSPPSVPTVACADPRPLAPPL